MRTNTSADPPATVFADTAFTAVASLVAMPGRALRRAVRSGRRAISVYDRATEMAAPAPTVVRTYCTLCGVGCPAAITVAGSSVRKLEPDREHPDGGAVCAKGRAAPEIHESTHRINSPLVRTAPKDATDPGWRRASWDEALGLVAERMLAIRRESGPQAIAFARGTGSGTGLSPTEPWVARLAGAFGSPNYMTNTHICNWARDGTNHYTFGSYEFPLPEVEKSGCLLLWGSNPTATLLNLATRIVAARARGLKLVVIDPRRIGLANKADHHLAVLAAEARRHEPDLAAEITGVPAAQIRETVAFLIANRPLSHHTWNGIMQHTNATLAGRAISVFYALTGDWDRPGGNVLPGPNLTKPISLEVTAAQAALRLGRDDRPLGPQVAPPHNIASYDLYDAILGGRPYQVRGLVSFGSNTIVNSADPVRGREALRKLEFFAQAELFHTPTTQFADVLLPAASFLETEFLVIRHGKVQPRRRAVAPLHERRPDIEIIFDLAVRLGLRDAFPDGNLAPAYDDVVSPMGVTWEEMREHPHGLGGGAPAGYEKHAQRDEHGAPKGFATTSGKVEIFLDSWAAHGADPLPVYREPAESPRSTPELAARFPLVLTNAKKAHYLHSQHRGIAALRRLEPHPTAEIHPDTAAEYGVADGQWVEIATSRGRARAKAEVTTAIMPGGVCAYHGWREGCEALGLPASDPYDERGSNVNLLVHGDLRDPISGALPHRSALCSIRVVSEES